MLSLIHLELDSTDSSCLFCCGFEANGQYVQLHVQVQEVGALLHRHRTSSPRASKTGLAQVR